MRIKKTEEEGRRKDGKVSVRVGQLTLATRMLKDVNSDLTHADGHKGYRLVPRERASAAILPKKRNKERGPKKTKEHAKT